MVSLLSPSNLSDFVPQNVRTLIHIPGAKYRLSVMSSILITLKI